MDVALDRIEAPDGHDEAGLASVGAKRNGRQIDVLRPPRNLGSINVTTDRFWGIEVDFDASLDEFFSITTSKQQVRPDDRVWDMLKDKAGTFAAITQMRRDYEKEAKIIAAKAADDRETKKASVESIEEAAKFRTTKPGRETSLSETFHQLAETIKRRALVVVISDLLDDPDALVGALKQVGQGEMTAAQFEALLASRDRAQCPPLAPPQGLCLIEVLY